MLVQAQPFPILELFTGLLGCKKILPNMDIYLNEVKLSILQCPAQYKAKILL
jgi:hypothetical protein